MPADDISAMIASLSGELGLDPATLAMAVLGLLVVIVLVLVTFIGYFRVLLNIAVFAYPVARVKAIGNPFILPGTMDRIMEAGTTYEVITFLRESGAGIEIPDNAGGEEMDRILDEWFLREFSTMETSLPDGIQPFFSAYRSMLEAEQITSAVRIVHAAGEDACLSGRILPVGELIPQLIEHLDGVGGIRELASRLQATPYGAVLERALIQYEEISSPFPLEVALWQYALGNLHSSCSKVDSSLLPAVTSFVGSFIDVTNILILIRARAGNVPPDKVAGWFVPGGAVYEEWRLRQLYENPTVEEIFHQLEGNEYHDILLPLVSRSVRSGSLYPLELAFDRYLLEKVSTLSTLHHLTGGPLIKFAVARRYETRNLRIIFHSLREGMPLPEAASCLVLLEAAA